MELSNSFEVERPIDEAWAVLTDVERIAPCLPGAKLEEVDGDEYKGIVKVKVGPITAQYKGTATFVERDDDAHRAVLKADGRDTRGAGNASALITARAEALGPTTTKVDVDTDMTVTGKVGPVRPGRDGRRERQADEPVRRQPRRDARGRRGRRVGRRRGRCRPRFPVLDRGGSRGLARWGRAAGARLPQPRGPIRPERRCRRPRPHPTTTSRPSTS